MRVLMTLAISLVLSASAFALTLDDAISLTLENDEAIKQQRALVESQAYTKRTAMALFLPSLDLEYTGAHAEWYDPDADGGDSASMSATLGYNLFNGLSDYQTYKMSSAAYDAQLLQYNAGKQDTILNVKKAYINYLMAKDAVDVANETLQLLEVQRNTAEISYQIGSFARTDVLQVEVQVASSKLELLNAEKSFTLARKQLEKYIGRPLNESEPIEDLVLSEYSIPALDDLYNYLENNRSEMILVKINEETADMNKKKSMSNFMPKVNAFATYTFYGDDGFNPFDGRSGSAPGGSDTGMTFGIKATWNIFQGFSSYNTYMANAKSAMAAAHSVSDTRNNLRLALVDAYESYFSAKEQLEVARVGLEQAEENYRVTKTQYDNSQATTTDLLNANVALNKAKTSLSAAKYGIISAVATLERSVETGFLGIDYDDPDEK